MILVSPAERGPVLHALGRAAEEAGVPWRSSSWPEQIGCDFAWTDCEGAWQGLQRKEVMDFCSSLEDGRLRKELGQLRAWVTSPQLVIEGHVQWAAGQMVKRYGRGITEREWDGMMLSLAADGVFVHRAAGVNETARLVVNAYRWWQKAEHGSLHVSVKPAGDWGRATNRDYQLALLTMVPGVGAGRAKAIVDHFGGLPWRWDVTAEQLAEVGGVGKKTAEKMLRVFTHTRDQEKT